MPVDRNHIAKVIATYDDPAHAARLLKKPADAFMPAILARFPAQAKTVLDLGAGPGRDAAWLAARGYEVTAVEPAAALRHAGADYTRGKNVHWRDDSLPALSALLQEDRKYDVIMLMAVWMFLPPETRAIALTNMKQLLAPGGVIIIVNQEGGKERADIKYSTTQSEFVQLAGQAGFTLSDYATVADYTAQQGPLWHTVVFSAAPE